MLDTQWYLLPACSGCSFLSKTIRVEGVGAIAAIITDHDHENNQVMVDMINDGTDRTTTLPAFFMLGKDGYAYCYVTIHVIIFAFPAIDRGSSLIQSVYIAAYCDL